MMESSLKFLSLSKSRGILHACYALYQKKGNTLAKDQKEKIESLLEQLDQAVLSNDREKASAFAVESESFSDVHFKKTSFDYFKEVVFALIFALVIATVVRQTWFELYEIPTGSMRPTFKEQDHLTVTKLAYGINCPLATSHLYFDPNLVQRTSIVIFSGDNIHLSDTDSTYFWLFPYKKRYIKRCMGKPGDHLYFYGGQLYGIDRDGNPIPELLNSPWIENIEHIPFLSFEGTPESVKPNSIEFYQMDQAIGKYTLNNSKEIVGEVFNGKSWVTDQPMAQATPHHTIKTYSDFWGMRNYAMTRLLTKKEAETLYPKEMAQLTEGVLYLELRHTPSLTYPKPRIYSYGVFITPYTTLLPLNQEHLDAIMDHMYTARFVVKDQRATRYSLENVSFDAHSPSYPNVQDGTYEFYYGKADRIGWGAIPWALSSENALYQHTPENIQRLYNLGIEFNTHYSPQLGNVYYPHRYGYFRNGDLYLLGAPILKKTDPELIAFNQREQDREKKSTTVNPYVAFKDYGPPVKDGQMDAEFIKAFGLKVPEHHYLCLGDNHAMSADSRVFGFVPEENLQGAPSLIIWPPGDRLGPPPQKPYEIFNIPRMIVWSLVLVIFGIWYAYHSWRNKRPVFKKLK